MIRRALILLALPTVFDLIVQICRLISCRALAAPGAAETVTALCHPTEGAAP